MNITPSPKGLLNLGNTCYFNSVVQCLLNTPLFGYLLDERANIKDYTYVFIDPSTKEEVEIELPECNSTVASVIQLYKDYIANNKTKSIGPFKLLQSIRQQTGRFPKLVQEDSHELLRSLIDIIRSDEIKRHKTALSKLLVNEKLFQFKNECYSVIDMLFGGYFLSSVQCQKCRGKSQHLEPFYDISLAITGNICDVSEAIANFSSNAILDGDNKVICERCTKVNGEKTYEAGEKSTTIAVPPNILTLHLKRFETLGGLFSNRICKLSGGRKARRNDGNNKKTRRGRNQARDNEISGIVGGRGNLSFRKIDKHIEFYEFLNLAEHTDNLSYDLTKINGWKRLDYSSPIWYALFGVVCHSGNLKGGHYTCYVKFNESIHDSDNEDLAELAKFIRETPYVPGSCDIEKIRESLKRYESTHSYTSEQYKGDFIGEHDSETNSDATRSNPGTWYYISDSSVTRSNLATVLKSQAYILFYRKVI